MTKFTVEVPNELADKFQQQGYDIHEIITEALENYLEAKATPIPKTKTWELCGSLEISESEPKYIVASDREGKIQTNYAENVDDVIYSTHFH